MARAIQRGAPALSRRAVLAAALARRFPPLRLAASLRPGLGPLLTGLLFGLGSRRLFTLFRRLRPRRRHRLAPPPRGGGRGAPGPRVPPLPPCRDTPSVRP